MKKRNVLMSYMVLLGLLLNAHWALGSEQTSSQREFNERFTQGMLSGDSSKFVELFSEDVKIFPEYDKAFLGKKHAKDYYDELLNSTQIIRYERSTSEWLDLGERHLEIGFFHITFKREGINKPISVPGTYFEVWDTSSKNNHKLLSQAWNYDKKVEGMKMMLRVTLASGVRYSYEPVVPLNSTISYELAARRALNGKMMLQHNTEVRMLGIADDAQYSTHDVPLLIGKQAIRDYWAKYASNWPEFDYLDTNVHQLHIHKDYVLTHMSYNLRWRDGDYSGVGTGKGIALYKRNANGMLQKYRSIAAND